MLEPRRSPLADRHRALGATMTDFAGWRMPVHYGSVVAEHRAVRSGCGAFDLSHLGTLLVTGPGARDAVQGAFSNDVDALAPGRAQYTLCMDAAGGILDDLLVYRVARLAYLVVPNAANTATVSEVLRARPGDAEVADVKADHAIVALQGPASADVATAAGLDVRDMAFLDVRDLATGGWLACSGYTGERGYEVFVTADKAPTLWDRAMAAGATPAGLGARDTLRLEMGYPLHGQDISPETSPVEARLTWAVKPDTDFVGRDAYLDVKAAGPRRRLWGMRALDRGIPRPHCAVSAQGRVVGEVTSGTFSPTLRLGIALAYLDAEVSDGDRVDIDVRGRPLPAEVTRPPFVDAGTKG
ncbi:MAG: glycine cleavage system aminomethyltransferase GcvT [Actinomycetota bacterium]|nr:glycine cleavage system aminomethyltransferase GcvT [Actinomycetota bacterium]